MAWNNLNAILVKRQQQFLPRRISCVIFFHILATLYHKFQKSTGANIVNQIDEINFKELENYVCRIPEKNLVIPSAYREIVSSLHQPTSHFVNLSDLLAFHCVSSLFWCGITTSPIYPRSNYPQILAVNMSPMNTCGMIMSWLVCLMLMRIRGLFINGKCRPGFMWDVDLGWWPG